MGLLETMFGDDASNPEAVAGAVAAGAPLRDKHGREIRRKWHDKEPSEDFNAALERYFSAGTCWITCEWCGREWFCTDGSYDFEEGEYEGLLKRQQENPDMCLGADYSIQWGVLNGRQYVVGCLCNYARVVQENVVRHRFLYLDYLKRRAKSILEDAQYEKELVEGAPES